MLAMVVVQWWWLCWGYAVQPWIITALLSITRHEFSRCARLSSLVSSLSKLNAQDSPPRQIDSFHVAQSSVEPRPAFG